MLRTVYSSLHIFCKRSHVAQAHLELSMQPKEAHELMALLFPFPGAGISVCTNTPGFYSSGFELRALWILGKNSANWDSSQVLFLHLLLIWQILLEHCPYKIYCDMSSYESYSLKTSIFIFSIFFGFFTIFFFVCGWNKFLWLTDSLRILSLFVSICLHVYMFIMCVVPLYVRTQHQIPWDWITGSYQLPYGCWAPNASPLWKSNNLWSISPAL